MLKHTFPMKKMLVLNPFPVFPPVSGGQSRVFYLYKYLAKYCEVVLLCFADKRSIKEISPNLKQITIPKSPLHIRKELQFFRKSGICTCAVMPLFSHLSPEFACILQKQAKDAAVIILSHPYLFDEVEKLRNPPPLIYDAHNVEFKLQQQVLPAAGKDLLTEVYRVESSTRTKSRLIVPCSQQDANTLASLYNIFPGNFFVVPNGADINAISFISRKDCAINRNIHHIVTPQVLFVGGHHQPNIAAAEEIITIAQQLPSIHFLLLGGHCQAVKQQQLPNNVTLYGIVDEQQKKHIFSIADLALNPVCSGSGTNIKMFDYMAAGIPIITTSFGARGIGGIDGKHYILCQLSNMPAQIKLLLNHPAKGELLATQAFSLVKHYFNWENIADKLITKIHAVVQ